MMTIQVFWFVGILIVFVKADATSAEVFNFADCCCHYEKLLSNIKLERVNEMQFIMKL